jgi:tRNA (cmo5U34)-methyltransferase
MNDFDLKAREWETNPVHWERSEAVFNSLLEMIPLRKEMNALEYGAGTGILSFMLHERLSKITMMDSSSEMVKVMKEKVTKAKVKNLKPLFFDLEHQSYSVQKFDFIFNQMVLHHVRDIDLILHKFYELLTPGGYLAIADLFPEDGSFHGKEVHDVHLGFDVTDLTRQLQKIGFTNIRYGECFVIKKQFDEHQAKDFPIFLLVASK